MEKHQLNFSYLTCQKFAHLDFGLTRVERRVLLSNDFLEGLQDLRVFMNYLHARKIWDKIDEITRNGGKVSNEEMSRMLSEGYV
jgi:hypothetical protein